MKIAIPPVLRCIQVLVAATVLVGLTSSVWGATKYNVLHHFGSNGDGTLPHGAPVLDRESNVYGVTVTGGTGQAATTGAARSSS